MSLVFTFLCATNQTKDFTLKGTWEFQTNFEGKFWGDPEDWDNARKNDLTEKSPEEDNGHTLASRTEGEKYKSSRDCMRPSKSSISKSDRLRQKFKFQEKGRDGPRTEEIEMFLSTTTLNSLGYWVSKGWSPHHKSSQNQILVYYHIPSKQGKPLKDLCNSLPRTAMWPSD